MPDMLPRLTHTTENTFLGFSIVINRKQASPAVWKPGKENLFFLCFILLPSIQAVQIFPKRRFALSSYCASWSVALTAFFISVSISHKPPFCMVGNAKAIPKRYMTSMQLYPEIPAKSIGTFFESNGTSSEISLTL